MAHPGPGELLRGGLRKGAWTREEDVLLKKCVERYGEGKWRQVPCRAGLKRCRKSCRLRWLNYLSPDIKRGEFSEAEVELIIKLHKLLGNRWSLIAGRIPGRTANDIKNFWNSHLSKKLARNCDEESGKSKQRQQKHVVIKPKARVISTIHSSWFNDQLTRTKVCLEDDNIPVPEDMNMICSASSKRHEPQLQLEDYSASWWENLVAQVEGIGGGGDSASSPGLEPVGMRNEVNDINKIALGGEWDDWLLNFDAVS